MKLAEVTSQSVVLAYLKEVCQAINKHFTMWSISAKNPFNFTFPAIFNNIWKSQVSQPQQLFFRTPQLSFTMGIFWKQCCGLFQINWSLASQGHYRQLGSTYCLWKKSGEIPGMYKTLNKWDKLATSTGAGFLPSTVSWKSYYDQPPSCMSRFKVCVNV